MKPKSLPFIAFEHKRCVPSFTHPATRCSRRASIASDEFGLLPSVPLWRFPLRVRGF